jgi:alpha-tubulin suppressor-like RCC1 family protein
VNEWLVAALSQDQDVYLWGGRVGEQRVIRALENVGTGDGDDRVAVVDIEGVEYVRDVAVGAGHVAVVSSDGQLFVAGAGDNGQLGISGMDGKALGFAHDWVRVEEMRDKRILGVHCGDRNTFVLVSE